MLVWWHLNPRQEASLPGLMVWKRDWEGLAEGSHLAERWAVQPVLWGRAVLPYLSRIGWVRVMRRGGRGKSYDCVAACIWWDKYNKSDRPPVCFLNPLAMQ